MNNLRSKILVLSNQTRELIQNVQLSRYYSQEAADEKEWLDDEYHACTRLLLKRLIYKFGRDIQTIYAAFGRDGVQFAEVGDPRAREVKRWFELLLQLVNGILSEIIVEYDTGMVLFDLYLEFNNNMFSIRSN